MPSANTQKIWKFGIPLNDAWVCFANDESKKNFANAPTLLMLADKFTDHAATINGHEAIQLFSEHAAMNEAHRQLAETMKEALLEWLFNSQLIATGYMENPRQSKAPVFIDPTHFDSCNPNWDFSKIYADGCEWSQVRISVQITGNKGVVRGLGLAIRSVISQSLRDGVNLCAMPRKVAAQKVREKLSANSVDRKGLSDKNLARYIREICNKKSHLKN